MKYLKKRSYIYLMFFLISAFFLRPTALEASGLYDAHFYSGLKNIIVELHVYDRRGLTANKYLNVLKDHAVPRDLYQNRIIAAFKSAIHNKNIRIASPKEFGMTYAGADTANDSGSLFIYIDMVFWEKDSFNPLLNYDLAILSVKEKRLAPIYHTGDGVEFKIREIPLFAKLPLSVSDDMDVFAERLQEKMISYINENLDAINRANQSFQ